MVAFEKIFFLSKASLIAFSVSRQLIMLLLLESSEQGYIEVGKGFDRLDCPALGLAFSPRPPTAARSQSFERQLQGSSEGARTI